MHPRAPYELLDGPGPLFAREQRAGATIEWAALPRAEVVARRYATTHDAWIVGDLVIRDVGALRVEAHDLRSLEPRWTHDDHWFRHAVGCDRVIQATTGAVRALDVRTGAELWRRDTGGRVLAEIAGIEGCRVILELGGGRSEGTMLEVRILDAMTGRTIVRHPFGEPGMVRVASECEAIAWLRERSVAIPLDGGELGAVPEGTAFLSATRSIEGSDRDLRGRDRRTGAIAWSRTFDDHPRTLARTGDDLVVATRGEIRRIAMETGQDRWAIAVPLELTGHAGARISGPTGADVADERLVLSTDTEPPLLAQIDLAAGALSWMRLAPQRSHAVVIGGDDAVIWTQRSLAIIALPPADALSRTDAGDASAERDPAHHARVLRDEIRRALDLLALSDDERADDDAYPADAAEARVWLERLRPVARPILAELIDGASDRDAALGVGIFEGDVDPIARALVEELLTRSFGPPTPDRIALRAAASRAVSAPLPLELARALADRTIAWSGGLHDRPPHTCGPHPVDPLSDAVHASLAALERASTDPEPLRRLREHLFAHGRRGECTPSVDDEVRTAAVRWVIEAGVWFDGIDVSDGACIDLVAAEGRSLEPVSESYGALQVFAPQRLDAGAEWPPCVGTPEWDDGPTFTIGLATGTSMQGERTTLVLRLVRGEWRVIATTGVMTWTT